MADLPIALPTTGGGENIPAVLAAPKPKRIRPKAAPVGQMTAPIVDAVTAGPAATPAVATVADQPAMPVTGAPLPSHPTAAAPADTPVEEPTMTDTIQNVTKDTAGQAHATMNEMNDRAKDAMERGTALFADWSTFSRGNVEALVESGKIAMSGLSSLAQDRAAYVRKQMEDTTAAVRTMASIKSPTEFVKLQGDFVRDQFDAMVAETSRSTEAALKLAGEVAQPMANRFALAAEKVRHAG